jgi:hypothetical protein
MTTLTPTPKQQFLDANGNPLSGGKVYTYAAGTTTPLVTYTDESGTTPNTNPVILDSRGEAGIWLGVASYKLKLTTSTDVEIWTVDNIVSASVQALADLSESGGSALVGFLQAGTGAVATTVQAKLRETVSVKDFGAVGDGVADDTVAIQTEINLGRTSFPPGTYKTTSSLQYRKDQLVTGQGKSFSGSVIKPTGDFVALIPKVESPAIDYTKNTFRDFCIDASNIATNYAVTIDGAYLTEWENIWVRNSYKGINITNSDAITFNNVMIMENSNNDVVRLGDNARSIKFVGCNFEKNSGNTNPGGVVRLNGSGTYVTSADFYGCQIERGGLSVERGVARWFGGKSTDATVIYYPKAQSCYWNSTDYNATVIHDFGMNTVVENAHNTNMDTPRHQWPALVPTSTGSPVYGAASDEYLYMVSANTHSNAGAISCTIAIKEGATALATSPSFDLAAQGLSYGSSVRDTYTFVAGVKNSAAASGPIFTNCSMASIRGGKSLLTNGTFASGASTGWTLSSATGAASGDDLFITPSATNWMIYQSLASLLKYGKRYICVAKYSGTADLCLGNAFTGTVTYRPLRNSGVSNIYEDGDTISMLSFEFLNQFGNISLGSITSNTAVTVRWILLIEA